MRWMFLSLRLFGVAVLAAILVFVVDVRVLWDTLARMEPLWVAGAAVVNLPVLLLKAERWKQLLSALKLDYPRNRAWIAFAASLSAGIVTPGRVGELARVAYLGKDLGADGGTALASVLADRFLDMVVLSSVGVAALAVYQLRWSIPLWVFALFGPVIAAPGLLCVPAFRRFLEERLEKKAAPAKQSGLKGIVGGIVEGMARLAGPSGRRALLKGLALGAVAFCLVSTQTWFVASGLDIGIGWLDVALMLALANLAGSLPLSVAGVGTRDAVFVLLMNIKGLPAESAVALGAGFLLCNVCVCFLLGLVVWEVWPPGTMKDNGNPQGG